ncbi:hypothetical protein, partial [Escherichia coli]|uniref:hypothetical protein n=1 Tax=Escherichia coli TaxID=562 RepID=UPI001BC85D3F
EYLKVVCIMVLMLLLAGLGDLHFHQRGAMATSVVLAMMAVSPAQVVPGGMVTIHQEKERMV